MDALRYQPGGGRGGGNLTSLRRLAPPEVASSESWIREDHPAQLFEVLPSAQQGGGDGTESASWDSFGVSSSKIENVYAVMQKAMEVMDGGRVRVRGVSEEEVTSASPSTIGASSVQQHHPQQ